MAVSMLTLLWQTIVHVVLVRMTWGRKLQCLLETAEEMHQVKHAFSLLNVISIIKHLEGKLLESVSCFISSFSLSIFTAAADVG